MSSAVDGDIPRLVDNLGVVRPTFMAGAPRIFEKVYARVLTPVEEEGGIKLKIFNCAFSVGKQHSGEVRTGRQPNALLGLQYRLSDRLVFSKLRSRFGGRVRFFVSGSAPLSKDIAGGVHAANLLLLHVYGR